MGVWGGILAHRSVSDLLARKSVECLFLYKLKGKKGPSGDLDGFKNRGVEGHSVVPIVLGATVSPLFVMLA